MITEDYVSFEVAKLLKEKGFDGDTNCYYIEGSVDKNLYYSPIRNNHNKRITDNEFDIHIDIDSDKISAPTLQMAMKWLREVHGLNVQPCIVRTIELKKAYNTTIYNNNCEQIKSHFGKNIFDGFISYEEACEAAIKYCLENLI